LVTVAGMFAELTPEPQLTNSVHAANPETATTRLQIRSGIDVWLISVISVSQSVRRCYT
jgi:hypothetical protein